MDDIVVIGGGGHARVVISIINRLEGLNLIGYVDPVDHGDVLGAVAAKRRRGAVGCGLAAPARGNRLGGF